MSNRPGPPIGRHCPLKSGYFVSSHARVSAIETHSAATSAVAASEPRYIMAILPCDHGPCRRSKAQDELVSLLLFANLHDPRASWKIAQLLRSPRRRGPRDADNRAWQSCGWPPARARVARPPSRQKGGHKGRRCERPEHPVAPITSL